MTRKQCIDRAQAMSNRDGLARWVKFTSIGWRIERTPSAPDYDDVTVAITPKAEGK